MDIEKEKDQAKKKAIDSLARYKFQMFGYYAALWVTLNRLGIKKDPNPFTDLVTLARQMKEETDAKR